MLRDSYFGANLLKSIRKIAYEYEEVTDQVQNYHNSKKSEPPYAIIKKNMIFTYPVAANTKNWGQPHLFLSSMHDLPEQIIIFFVPQSAWDGNIHQDPFHWPEIEFEEIGLWVNSNKVPNEYMENVTKMGKLDLFEHFQKNTGFNDLERSQGLIQIDQDRYEKNFFCIPFDRTQAKHNGFYQTVADSGHIDIHLKIRTVKNEPYYVGVYASYSEKMVLDSSRVSFEPVN